MGAPHIPAQRLLYFNAGFARQRRLRLILRAAGYDLKFGYGARPSAGDSVVVWGKSPTSARCEAFAARHGLPIVRVEDAFVRSAGLGRAGVPPVGVMIDPIGVHFAAAHPSRLEQILARDPLDDAQLLARAKAGLARLRRLDISKYNLHDTALTPPAPGYVLVVDQTRGDASIVHGQADSARFAQMLACARAEHPSARILIKTHPETANGYRAGHFGAADCDDQVQLLTANLSPWAALNGAIAVYTVSSQLGLEAVFAGHRPQVFGAPFYAGWGLTDDRIAIARRGRRLTRAQLFAASHLIAPTWFDPYRETLCSFEEMLDLLEADLRAARDDAAGYVAVGMRAWKRRHLQGFFGKQKPVLFANSLDRAAMIAQRRGAKLMVWGAAQEHGFASPYWMTFQQALELGGCVRMGERGSKVVKAGQSVFGDQDAPDQSDGEDGVSVRRWLKAYTVFNSEQIDGLPERYSVKAAEPGPLPERIAAADAFFANIPAKVINTGDRAFYRISTDDIHMPPLELFSDAEHHAATLAHELIHWTRHPDRLDRDFGRKTFGDDGYAKEECCAELGAAFVGAILGLRPSHIEDHAAYIGSWLKVLKDDKRFIFTAAGHAQRAVNLLESYQPGAALANADGASAQEAAA